MWTWWYTLRSAVSLCPRPPSAALSRAAADTAALAFPARRIYGTPSGKTGIPVLYTWVCLASATIPKVHGPILLCHTFLRFAFPAAVDGTSDNANLRQAGLEVQTPQQMQEEKGGGGEEEGNEEGKGNEVC